jgi:hypothetical protein
MGLHFITERLASERPYTRACCPPIFNNDTLICPWMQLFFFKKWPMDAALLLHFASSSTPAARLWIQLCAPRLMPAHARSFVLRAYYHAHGYSFVLCTCCRARFASRAHTRTTALDGTTSSCAPCHACL